MKKEVVIGLSGGIDSFTALFLLKKTGWAPVGVSLKIPFWKGQRSFQKVKDFCRQLNVPFFLVSVEKEFKKVVLDYFIDQYKRGFTPNPCIICNPGFKFKTLFSFAHKKGVNFVATGHYARIKKIAHSIDKKKINYQLLKAKDKNKDQSYYLALLPRKWLKNIIFPLGEYEKEAVIKIAKRFKITDSSLKKPSQDFCYCPNKNLEKFLLAKIGQKPGKIVHVKGQVLGQHQGLHFYTPGQRKGIELPNGPWYVKELQNNKNHLVVSQDKKELYQQKVWLKDFYLAPEYRKLKKIKVWAKLRYGQKLKKAVLNYHQSKKSMLFFEKPQRAVAPGQFAVCYQKDLCLGAGRIL